MSPASTSRYLVVLSVFPLVLLVTSPSPSFPREGPPPVWSPAVRAGIFVQSEIGMTAQGLVDYLTDIAHISEELAS